ncbi:hypothetical protein FACS1894219_00850 [Clostridia bacterium]|nr:hypothetical protein FACS1894219_00850 [Clostridia bacterium]
MTSPHRSPKIRGVYDIYDDIYHIKEFIAHDKFTLKIVLLEVTETKYLDGWGKYRKNNATKVDRIPREILEEVTFENASDYVKLIPKSLREAGNFTTPEIAKLSGKRGMSLSGFLKVMKEIGIIMEDGKDGRVKRYKIVNTSGNNAK